MSPADRFLVLVPAHNEADCLPAVVNEVRAIMPGVDLLVVDDGSVDDTPAVQVAFTGYPSGYVNRTTLTGQPNNPSMAVATRRLTAASENPGAFATDRTDIALAFTVAVEMEP